METLKGLIDLFASMRINHLQLYMEGFSFDYEDFHYLFTNETPVTPEEFRELSQYARAHFIDLVPNQNVLGHMEKWLEKPKLRTGGNAFRHADGCLLLRLYQCQHG